MVVKAEFDSPANRGVIDPRLIKVTQLRLVYRLSLKGRQGESRDSAFTLQVSTRGEERTPFPLGTAIIPRWKR